MTDLQVQRKPTFRPSFQKFALHTMQNCVVSEPIQLPLAVFSMPPHLGTKFDANDVNAVLYLGASRFNKAFLRVSPLKNQRINSGDFRP
jgi:hypothetical protein